MKFLETPLNGAYMIELEPFIDDRGYFERLFCKNELKEINFSREIAQINHSLSRAKGTVRGMHYQLPPNAETKIIKSLRGSVYDVIIDLRKNSPTFLNWFGVTLSADNMKMIFVPEGFAHGFQTLEDNSELLYFHSELYTPRNERAIRYNDPLIDIKWPLDATDISDKDKKHPLLDNTFQGVSL
jgi:dTDP-4-dehydrorhamnose 3,5-epimerase